ncbi:hypothetical protein ACIQXF_17440 [Lysinibacillus sp. NPDC097231]|uniref:hypothetical protein n=1 Tax=Lysinibacillus sp. NPDC097231 TaxID=3364142 RepID=UPI0037FCE603
MKIKNSLLFAALLCFLIVGCNEAVTVTSTSKKPDAAEILRLQNDADFFQWEGSFYQTNIEWIDELELHEDQQIGEIEFHATKAEEFKNGAANHLPIGAKVYSVQERNDILIVKYDHIVKRYLAHSEG